jgi:hypothetical protein
MNDAEIFYRAARWRRGRPPRRLSIPELASELRSAGDALARGDDATFSKSLARFLAEYFAAVDGRNLLMAARSASSER